jgi:hypothetical protein
LLLDCSLLFPECSARARIYNELEGGIFVTIDDERRYIPGWGICIEEVIEGLYKTVACNAVWDLNWPKPSNTSCTSEETTEPEPECEAETYSLVFNGVSGLTRSITLDNDDFVAFTVKLDADDSVVLIETTPATSSTVPKRSTGIRSGVEFRFCATISVAINAEVMVLTVIPSLESRNA